MVIPWDVNLWDWVHTVQPASLPVAPFPLAAGVVVVDGPKWLAALQVDALRRKGPRARFGAIQKDMRNLWELMNK